MPARFRGARLDLEITGLDIDRSDRLCIAGLPRTGKSTFIEALATMLAPRVLVYDSLNQYHQLDPALRYVPDQHTPEEFEMVCRRLCATPNMTFIVEEAQEYIGQDKPLGRYASMLIKQGRNWGVGVYACSQRIQSVNKDFVDLCVRHVLFQCGVKSREYIASMFGMELAMEVTDLPDHHFLYYKVDRQTYRVCVLDLA
jgi:hypothetical protein